MADKKTPGVPVLAPDGKVYLIPAEHVAEATMRGGQLVQRMQAPGGTQHWIPTEQAEEAQRRGAHFVKQDGSAYEEGTEPRIVGRNSAGRPIWGAEKEEQPGFLESAGNAVTNAVKGVGQFLDPRPTEEEKARGLTTPYDTLMRYPERMVAPNVDMAAQVDKDIAEGRYGQAAAHAAGAVVPMVGPWAAGTMEQAGGQAGQGNWSGAAGTVAGNALAAEAGELVPKALGAVGTAAKGRLAEMQAPLSALDKPITPGELSPAERYDAAKGMGVNLDRAQATNAPIPRMVKRTTEHSLTGSGQYEQNTAANVEALHAHANELLDGTAPAMSREQFGSRAQQALHAHRAILADEPGQTASAQALLDSASPTRMDREEFGDHVKGAMEEHRARLDDHVSSLYDALDARLGDKQPDISQIQQKAQGIVQKNQRFYDAHPELLKGGDARAWAIVKDLARDNEKLLQDKAPVTRWADLQQARSHLLDLSRGPEFVGDLATGWIKQLTGAIDDTMTSAEKTPGLTAKDVKDFRTANATYKDLKSTYDDPQSPFYWVARQDGLKAADRLNNLGPEDARAFRDTMTEGGHPELIGQQQRQALSRIFDPPGNGTLDLDGLASRWNRANKEQVGGILTPNHMSALDDLADRSTAKTPYDTPGSQLKQVINAPDGSTAAQKIFNDSGKLLLTPEEFQQLSVADPTLAPQLQRQAISRVLNPADNAAADLRNFPSRWNRSQKEQLQGVLTPEQTKALDNLASVSKVVHADTNPSGTAKVIQPAAEISGLVGGVTSGASAALAGHPVAGAVSAAAAPAAMLAEKAVSSRMVDPAATEAVMRHAAPVPVAQAVKDAAVSANPTRTAAITAGAGAGTGTAQDDDKDSASQARAPMKAPIPPSTQGTVKPALPPQDTSAPAQVDGRAVLSESPGQTQLGSPGSGTDTSVPSAGQTSAAPSAPKPQSSVVAPEGATHEVLDPEGKTVLGHVVDGEYVPYMASA